MYDAAPLQQLNQCRRAGGDTQRLLKAEPSRRGADAQGQEKHKIEEIFPQMRAVPAFENTELIVFVDAFLRGKRYDTNQENGRYDCYRG